MHLKKGSYFNRYITVTAYSVIISILSQNNISLLVSI